MQKQLRPRPRWWLASQGVITLGLSIILLTGIMSPGGFDGWTVMGLTSSSFSFFLNLITLRQWRHDQGHKDH